MCGCIRIDDTWVSLFSETFVPNKDLHVPTVLYGKRRLEQWGTKKWLHFAGNCFSTLLRLSYLYETLHSGNQLERHVLPSSRWNIIISSIKITGFCDMMQRSLLHRSKCFGVSCCLYLQSRRASRVWVDMLGIYSEGREEQELWDEEKENIGYNQFQMLTSLIFPEDGGGISLRNIDNDHSDYTASHFRSHWRDSLKS
jgi:hypothetical protein